MRSGTGRRAVATIALGICLAMGQAVAARAGGIFHRTIPRETLAMDYRTGDVMMAPPIPYGHYAKDDYIGCVKSAAGLTFGAVHGLVGKVKGLCSKCGSGLCGLCGGGGRNNGGPCGGCAGSGCGRCHGLGLGAGAGLGSGGLGSGGLFHGFDPGGGHGHVHGGAGLGGLGHSGDTGMACVGPGCGTVQGLGPGHSGGAGEDRGGGPGDGLGPGAGGLRRLPRDRPRRPRGLRPLRRLGLAE